MKIKRREKDLEQQFKVVVSFLIFIHKKIAMFDISIKKYIKIVYSLV